MRLPTSPHHPSIHSITADEIRQALTEEIQIFAKDVVQLRHLAEGLSCEESIHGVGFDERSSTSNAFSSQIVLAVLAFFLIFSIPIAGTILRPTDESGNEGELQEKRLLPFLLGCAAVLLLVSGTCCIGEAKKLNSVRDQAKAKMKNRKRIESLFYKYVGILPAGYVYDAANSEHVSLLAEAIASCVSQQFTEEWRNDCFQRAQDACVTSFSSDDLAEEEPAQEITRVSLLGGAPSTFDRPAASASRASAEPELATLYRDAPITIDRLLHLHPVDKERILQDMSALSAYQSAVFKKDNEESGLIGVLLDANNPRYSISGWTRAHAVLAYSMLPTAITLLVVRKGQLTVGEALYTIFVLGDSVTLCFYTLFNMFRSKRAETQQLNHALSEGLAHAVSVLELYRPLLDVRREYDVCSAGGVSRLYKDLLLAFSGHVSDQGLIRGLLLIKKPALLFTQINSEPERGVESERWEQVPHRVDDYRHGRGLVMDVDEEEEKKEDTLLLRRFG